MTISFIRSKLRIAIFRFLMFAISLLIGLFLAEAITRVLFPQLAPRTARITKFWQYDSRYGWSHIPGVEGYFESFGIKAFVTINSKGFRGPETEYARDRKRPRILVLGDSYVWGYGVKDDDVFTENLRKMFPEAEIINMGVSGYSTDQELLLYRDEGYKYKADLIVIVLTENDPLGNMLTEQYVTYGKPAFQISESDTLTLINQPVHKTPLWKRAVAQFATQSYVLTAVNRYLYSKAIGGNVVTAVQKKNSDDGLSNTSINLGKFPRTQEEKITARLLLELKRDILSRQGEGELLVLFTEDLTASQEMAEYITPFGISCLDLEATIDAKDQSLHLPDDFHWNTEGHKKVAGVLAEYLSKSFKQINSR